ncbi:hypothetical protein GCK72_018129 [Caenorhabditis remanei]|uniref:Uncharacterized protein n=1 Tax=Caenorhabditis remanei TaxID=31234 RepID=A0A6A5GAC2_CAERE|nr:hypothetical protein GCK72_018129 [Caenorhabditis remanei]KAF1751575.1 hypothetical protein GCK72_018129 [Caenorhabditis remanei]
MWDTISGVSKASTNHSAPRFLQPPPAPVSTTICPGFTFDSLSALYTVTPAQRIGAAAARLVSLLILAASTPRIVSLVSEFPSGNILSNLNNTSSSFVSSNQWADTHSFQVSKPNVKIGVADSRIFDFDKDLIISWSIEDESTLGGWEFNGHLEKEM